MPPVVVACVGAEGRHCGQNRQDHCVRPFQTHQHHSVYVPQGWYRPGTMAYAGILAATGLNGVSEKAILSVFGSYSVVFLYRGARGRGHGCVVKKGKFFYVHTMLFYQTAALTTHGRVRRGRGHGHVRRGRGHGHVRRGRGHRQHRRRVRRRDGVGRAGF